MARPRGSKNKAKTVPTSNGEVSSTHNSKPHVAKEPLSDDQLRALFFNHKSQYEKALEAKKKADATLKVVCKQIKAEGTKLDDIKTAIRLEEPEGEAELRAQIEREIRVARWVGLPLGTQLSLLDEIDRTPIDERAFEEGKRAGLKGQVASPPSSYAGDTMQKWMDGWSAGQAVLFEKGPTKAANQVQRDDDAKDFDQPIH